MMTGREAARLTGVDAPGDGAIGERREYVFTDWDPGRASDLGALRLILGIGVLEDQAKKNRQAQGTGDEFWFTTQCAYSKLQPSILRLQSAVLSYLEKYKPTAPRKNFNPAFSALFVLIFDPLAWSPAFGTTGLYNDLQSALEEMGYDSVIVENCGISLEASIEPNDANNGFSRYFRYIDISSIDFDAFQVSESISERHFGGSVYYTYATVFKDDYLIGTDQDQLSDFDDWARRTHPESNYPYTHAGEADIYSQRIFDAAVSMVDGIDELNRVVAYTNFGSALIVNDVFSFSSLNRDLLEESLDLMSALASNYPCNGTGVGHDFLNY